MNLINRIKDKARILNKKIVLPEGTEPRTLAAADEVISDGIANVILLGNPDEIAAKAKELGLKHIAKATIIDPLNNPMKDHYIEMMVEIRKSKNLTREEASVLIENPLYLAVLMIKNGDADCEVAGAANSTGDVLRPALQYVKTAPGISVVSGAFIMIHPDTSFGDNGVMVFADGAVTPDPTERELAEIAVVTARTTKAILGLEPRVAMISFSTKGSAKHPMVEKVVNATKLAKEMAPDIRIDGELQVDAALIEAICNSKAPGSPIAGKANIMIFPTLDVGNVAYKLVQRLGKAEAIGPVLQGMAAPINDLSRGCSINDIVSLIAITVNQASVN